MPAAARLSGVTPGISGYSNIIFAPAGSGVSQCKPVVPGGFGYAPTGKCIDPDGTFHAAAVLKATPTSGYHCWCPAACAAPIADTLTLITKYGAVAVSWNSLGGGGWYGETTASESQCASWGYCDNRTVFQNELCTFKNIPTTGTIHIAFNLTCGGLDSYGNRAWSLIVYRTFVWAYNDPCPLIDRTNPNSPTIDSSNGKCLSMAFMDYTCPGRATIPAGTYYTISSRGFAVSDGACDPVNVLIPIPPGSGNLSFGQTWVYPFSRGVGWPTEVGTVTCPSIPEFVDTVTVVG